MTSSSSSSSSSSSADAPLDDLDLGLLDRVREMYQAADPMPEDLPERICFLLALRDLEVEVARLAAGQDLLASAARGTEQSRTITFDSDSLTIMIRIDANGDGTVRVDGWLAPAQRRWDRAEDLRLGGCAEREQRRARALRLRPGAEGNRPADGPAQGQGRSVVTPALVL